MMREEITWYLDRICYYRGLAEQNAPSVYSNQKCYRLWGELEEYTGIEGTKNMRDFWVDGLNQFVKDEMGRKVKKETAKLRKELQEKEDKIRELVELVK